MPHNSVCEHGHGYFESNSKSGADNAMPMASDSYMILALREIMERYQYVKTPQ